MRGSIRKQPNGSYLPRFRGPDGREISKSFRRKIDAQRWLDEQTAALITGQYVDPRSGLITFRAYAEQWLAGQVLRPTTAANYEATLRLNIYPRLGDRPLAAIRPSEVQALVAWMGTDQPGHRALQPRTVRVAMTVCSSVFKAAVADRRIAANPCAGVRLPEVHKQRVEPLTTDQVTHLCQVIAPEWRAAVVLGAGTGVRQGEMAGVTADRVDFPRRALRVDRQLLTLPGREPFLAPVKSSSSVRTIPLPQVVAAALSAHLREHGTHADERLLFPPMRRSAFSGQVWAPARGRAGLPPEVTFHALRHYYASLLIRHGESVKTVQERLGHSSAAMTLDVYSHLWSDADDRTREAVDGVLGGAARGRGGLG